jgi:O-antigen/teichoic acid export membrane protein
VTLEGADPGVSPLSGPGAVGGRRALGDILVQVVGRVGNLALGVLVTALVARTLGDRGFGQWSTVFIVLQLATYFTDLGLESLAVQRAAADPEREPQWLGALLEIRVVLAVPFTVISAIVAVLLAESHQMLVTGLIASACVVVSVPSALVAAFQVRVRNHITTGIVTANSVLWAAAVIVLADRNASMVAFAVSFLAVAVVTSALQIFFALRTTPIRFGGTARLRRELIEVGVPLAISGVLITAYARIDQIIVFEAAGDRQAGLYAAAYRILEQSHFVPLAVMTTLFPMIAASYATDRARVQRLLQVAADYLAVVSLGALAFTLVASDQIIHLVFGPQFADAAPALPILMGAFVLISFGYLAGNMIIILRLQRVFIRYALLALAVNVILNLALVPTYGFLAAAWITLATEVVVVALSVRAVVRELGFAPSLTRILRTVVAAGLLAVALAGLREAGAELGILAAAAVVLYPALLIVLRAVIPREALAVLRRESP